MQVDTWHIEGTAFHFGRHGLGQEESRDYLPSDSLTAALLARLVALRGPQAVDSLAEAIRQDPPPFVLSSALPRVGSVRFFPTPLQVTVKNDGPTGEGVRPKDLKKIRFVSEGIFRALSEGRRLSAMYDVGLIWHEGQVLLLPQEAGALPVATRRTARLWRIEKRPRVTVGRQRHNSQIYFTGRTAFPAGGGLWFAIRWFDKAYQPLLEELLLELGLAGIGGERSSGFGQCTIIHQGAMTLPDPEKGYWVSLSRYWPQEDEMDALFAPRAAYATESVGGWVTSLVSQAQRRRTARMLSEGSVLGPAPRVVPGQMVDVQPDYDGTRPLGHPVWRSGRTLAVGLTLVETGDNRS